MRHMLHLAAAAVAALALAAPAAAITGGQPDGDAHPAVGALVADLPGGAAPICSAALIAPAVVVTAGHCTAWLPSLGLDRVSVTFDSALDPAGWSLRTGTFVTHPQFGRDRADTHDLAVVLLDEPVTGATPVALPAAGALDRLRLRDRLFTGVGYGYLERTVGGGPPRFVYDGLRRAAEAPYAGLSASWLRLLGNESATGEGGACFGDSGGPQLLGGVAVAVTSWGDAACSGVFSSYRLDTRSARAFLGRFVELP